MSWYVTVLHRNLPYLGSSKYSSPHVRTLNGAFVFFFSLLISFFASLTTEYKVPTKLDPLDLVYHCGVSVSVDANFV